MTSTRKPIAAPVSLADLGPPERSPLDTLVAMTLRSTITDPGDNFSSLAVAEAIDELLALDPLRRGSWRLRGLAEGYDLFAAPLAAPTAELARTKLVGLLESASDCGHVDRMAHLAAEHADAFAIIVAGLETPSIATILSALLDHDVDLAIRLASAATVPFASWQRFVDAALSVTEQDAPGVPNTRPLRPLLELLERWAASTPRGAKAMGQAILRLRAALA